MSLTDPRTVHVPEHLGDVDYEALLLDAPLSDQSELRTRLPRSRRWTRTGRGRTNDTPTSLSELVKG